jgi:uncharacterized RDD family membrane protein YckC
VTGAEEGGAAWFTAMPGEARRYQGRRAGLVSRVLAAAVDAAVVLLSLGGLYLVVSAVAFAVDPVRFTFPAPAQAVVVAFGFALGTDYFAVSWAVSGRTIGDQLLGLRVIGRRGPRVRLWTALLRALCSVLFPAGLLWVVVGSGRRSLADVLLGTSVVYDWNPHLRP